MAQLETNIEWDIRAALDEHVTGLVQRDGGLRNGHVPLWLIEEKDVPVNHANLELIGNQIDEEAKAKGSDGQIQPVMLGLVEERPKLDIIDGFHRFAKFQQLGRLTIFSTIIEVSYEELLDKRIQNTRNHAGLQFARATKWVRECWELNPFAQRISASQAFILGRLKGSTGSKLGLTPTEAEMIKYWVDDKAELWGVDPMTIYTYLKTDDSVVPALVHNSRPDRNQSSSPNSLPQHTITRIGRQIPNRNVLQMAIAKVIVEQRLSSTGISSILSDVKQLTDEEALAYLDTVDFAAYKERISSEQVYRFREGELLRLGRIRESSRVEPLAAVARMSCTQVDLVLNEGGYDPAKLAEAAQDLRQIGEELIRKAEEVSHILTGESATPSTTEDSEAPQQRTMQQFAEDLHKLMLDSSHGLQILTDREALAAERAIERGRGTKSSLDKLALILKDYYAIKEQRNG